MAKSTKVLLLTNYWGFQQIVPAGNVTFYQSHNLNNPDKPYKWKEMEADEAQETYDANEGRDPDFVSVKDAIKIATANAEEVARLKDELAKAQAKDDEIAKLKAELEAAKAVQTTAKPAAIKQA